MPDLAGGTHQVGVVQLCGDIVFFGLGEEPAKPQGPFEERQGGIERCLPFFNPKRGVFQSIADLQAAINAYLAEHNASPKPYV